MFSRTVISYVAFPHVFVILSAFPHRHNNLFSLRAVVSFTSVLPHFFSLTTNTPTRPVNRGIGMPYTSQFLSELYEFLIPTYFPPSWWSLRPPACLSYFPRDARRRIDDERPAIHAPQCCPRNDRVTNTFGTESAIDGGNISHYHVLTPTSKY